MQAIAAYSTSTNCLYMAEIKQYKPAISAARLVNARQQYLQLMASGFAA